MSIVRELAKAIIPSAGRRAVRRCASWIMPASKHRYELAFWDGYTAETGLAPEPDYYRRFMMEMGGVADASFFDGKVCLDVGCGPKGSLTWLTNAKAALGLDPLAEAYARFGIHTHSMIYLFAPAERIPLPSRYVDVVFSMNSLDHVDDVLKTCSEIRRVLKPGGHFIASLNLNEPWTQTEPWTLTESFLAEHLFDGWEREFYKVGPKLKEPSGPNGHYRYMYEEPPTELMKPGSVQALWCRFRTSG